MSEPLHHIGRLVEIKTILANMVNYPELKLALAFVFSFLINIDVHDKLVALLLLVIIDFSTGISVAKLKHEVISSRRAFATPIKLFVYMLMVITATQFERIVGVNILADEMVIVFLAATEFISIMENFGKLGFKTPTKLLNIARDTRDNLTK